MRPNTLADAVERIQAGLPQDAVLAEFVDTFDLAKTDQDRYASIEQEPKLTGDDRLDALVGAIAEYLAKQRRLGRVRIGPPIRRAGWTSPWFTASPTDAMREYLTFASPAEFASRNIFTEERPLRRARGPLTRHTMKPMHDHRHRRTGRLRKGTLGKRLARISLSPPRYRPDLPRGRQGAAGCRGRPERREPCGRRGP